jgi:hypothetical protein
LCLPAACQSAYLLSIFTGESLILDNGSAAGDGRLRVQHSTSSGATLEFTNQTQLTLNTLAIAVEAGETAANDVVILNATENATGLTRINVTNAPRRRQHHRRKPGFGGRCITRRRRGR